MRIPLHSPLPPLLQLLLPPLLHTEHTKRPDPQPLLNAAGDDPPEPRQHVAQRRPPPSAHGLQRQRPPARLDLGRRQVIADGLGWGLAVAAFAPVMQVSVVMGLIYGDFGMCAFGVFGGLQVTYTCP